MTLGNLLQRSPHPELAGEAGMSKDTGRGSLFPVVAHAADPSTCSLREQAQDEGSVAGEREH
jgi:hypothetical protein